MEHTIHYKAKNQNTVKTVRYMYHVCSGYCTVSIFIYYYVFICIMFVSGCCTMHICVLFVSGCCTVHIPRTVGEFPVSWWCQAESEANPGRLWWKEFGWESCFLSSTLGFCSLKFPFLADCVWTWLKHLKAGRKLVWLYRFPCMLPGNGFDCTWVFLWVARSIQWQRWCARDPWGHSSLHLRAWRISLWRR